MKIFDFINHASIKTSADGVIVLTDPWYVSNAFGSWYQRPSPRSCDIYDLIDTNDKMAVVISHGHDDHIDDYFIKHHMRDKTFFCAKFATPGLENRLSKQLGVLTNPIGESEKFGPFTFRQFVNPDFTKHDAVITIQTDDFVIIHANDNWHAWPNTMLQDIKKIINNYSEKQVYLLIQFGIADCFPINYPQFTEKEARQIIETRFKLYEEQTIENMSKMGLKHLYYYANQSQFHYSNDIFDSLYDEAQIYLNLLNNKKITQLTPGMSVHENHQICYPQKKYVDIFEYRLKGLENFLNTKFKSFVGEESFINTRLLVNESDVDNDSINYVTDISTWNRILTGDLNLESIIIGGSGRIFKPNLNIREHHMFVSKQSYIIQNCIKTSGISFFREHYS